MINSNVPVTDSASAPSPAGSTSPKGFSTTSNTPNFRNMSVKDLDITTNEAEYAFNQYFRSEYYILY